jgi:hypothetical protein
VVTVPELLAKARDLGSVRITKDGLDRWRVDIDATVGQEQVVGQQPVHALAVEVTRTAIYLDNALAEAIHSVRVALGEVDQ